MNQLESVRVGDRVSYEDMANPRRGGTVEEIRNQGWGTQFLVRFEDGELTYTDLRQRGWERACSICGATPSGHPRRDPKLHGFTTVGR